MHAQTTAGAGLPWAGMKNVKCSLEEKGGVITGKCEIAREGQEPIVLTASVPEGPVEKELLKRYAKDLNVATAQGSVGLFGFLKKIAKMAKKIVRGKVLGTLVKGFKSVMKIPILGPALGVAVPFMGATYLAMKGAEKLGISPWQARRMRKEKNPRKRAAFARKIKARMRLINRSRWMAARRRARGGRYRGRGWGQRWARRPRRSWRSYRARGYGRGYRPWGRSAGEEAAEEAQAGFGLLSRSRRGCSKAQSAIRCLNNRARHGNRKAILARKVLYACARVVKRRAKSGEEGEQGAYEALLANSSGSAEDDLENLITAAGAHVEDVLLAAGVEDGEELMAVAGVDLELERGPEDDNEDEDDAAAAGAKPSMDLGAYYNILPFQSAAYQSVAGYGPAAIGADAAAHTHQVPMPDYHCTPAVASVTTSAAGHEAEAGMHMPLIVTGADGVPRVKSWNGLRWVWSELRPHLGIKSETQGFGLRDAMLLGMRQIQQRELAS